MKEIKYENTLAETASKLNHWANLLGDANCNIENIRTWMILQASKIDAVIINR